MRSQSLLFVVPLWLTTSCGMKDAELGSGPDSGATSFTMDAATTQYDAGLGSGADAGLGQNADGALASHADAGLGQNADATVASHADAGLGQNADAALASRADAGPSLVVDAGDLVEAGDGETIGSDSGTLANDTVVLFGGMEDTSLADSNTWEWDAATWTWVNRMSGVGPSARTRTAMASLGNKVVLFGGSDGFQVFGDTWEWDGTSWTQLNIPGPPAREGHLMAAFNGGVVLLGGTVTANGGSWTIDDTWGFDGTKWTRLDAGGHGFNNGWGMASAPGASSGCVGNCSGEELVFFGAGISSNQTWMWDGSTWSQIDVPESNTSSYPTPGDGVLASLGSSILLLQSAPPPAISTSASTWQWTAGEWSPAAVAPSQSSGPQTRYGSAMASLAGSAIVYGGTPPQAGGPVYDAAATWVWNAGVWTQAPGAPRGRHGHAMATRFAR